MGFGDILDDIEKGLDWLGGKGKSEDSDPPDTEEMRKTLAEEVKAWADTEVNQFIALAGDSLPPIAKGMIRAKLIKFAEDAYGRGVSDAVKIAELSSSK